MKALKPAVLDIALRTRRDRAPRLGDKLTIGDESYEVVNVRVRVELRSVHDAEDTDD